MNSTPPGVSPEIFEEVVQGYLTCAAWADAPEGSNARFTKQAKRLAADSCSKFIAACGPLFQQAVRAVGYSPARFGHDFWLNRKGHGAGFWDRDELELMVEGTAPLAVDRNGARYEVTTELGKALSEIAYGTQARISRFAYHPEVEASKGWLYFT